MMPKNMRSSHKGKCIHLLLFLCIFYKIADWFSCSLLVVLSLLQNKEDVNRDWTKYDHYGSATMIMRLKATIQSLEGQMSSVTEKRAKYAQIAAEEVLKSLYCLGVRLTTELFQNSELQGKL